MVFYRLASMIVLYAIVLLPLHAQNSCPPFVNAANTIVSANTIPGGQGQDVQFTMEGFPACGTAFYLFEDGLFATHPNPLHSFYSAGNFAVKYYAFAAKDPNPPQERTIDSVNHQPNTIVPVSGISSLNSGSNFFIPPGHNIVLGQSWGAAEQNKLIYLLAFKHPGNDTSPINGSIELTLDPNVDFSRVITPDGTNVSHNNWAISSYHSSTHQVHFAFQNLSPGIQNIRHLYIEVDIPELPAQVNSLTNTVKMETKEGIDDFTLTSQLQSFPHDPNSIQIAEGCLRAGLASEQELNYTISFQNEGEAYAEDIKIETDLGAFVDPNSVVITKASAPLDTVYVNDAGRLVFEFHDINLPGLKQQHPYRYYPNQTTGFVQFSISSEEQLPANSEIQSAAEIFFDLQPPIHTGYDTVFIDRCCRETEKCDPKDLSSIGVDANLAPQVLVSPSPFTNQFTVAYRVSQGQQFVKIQLYSIAGKRLYAPLYQGIQEQGDYEMMYSVADLPAGMYILRTQIGNNVKALQLIKH